jgi:hypothetical protein
LDKERQRLVEARRRVEEQRRALLNTMSPTGKHEISYHNDKPFLPYEPYHFFENKEELIRNSLFLPITKEFPKTDNWKLKVKFVPMPIEDSDIWNKYKDTIVTEEEHEVDEAVKAFQSFTENKHHSQKPAYPKVRYVPQFTADNENWHSAKHQSRAHDNYKDYVWRSKMKNFGLSRSADDFRESFKFVSMHDKYRTPKHRDKKMITIQDTGQMENCSLNQPRQNGQGQDFTRKLKVKFRPMPSFGEPYRPKNNGPYWME